MDRMTMGAKGNRQGDIVENGRQRRGITMNFGDLMEGAKVVGR